MAGNEEQKLIKIPFYKDAANKENNANESVTKLDNTHNVRIPFLNRTNEIFSENRQVPDIPRKKITIKKTAQPLTFTENQSSNPFPPKVIIWHALLEENPLCLSIPICPERKHAICKIFEIHIKNDSFPEVPHLSVDLLDTYLSNEKISLDHIWLAGLASYRLSSKFFNLKSNEWQTDLEINKCLDNKYTEDQLTNYEKKIFKINKFKLYKPNPIAYVKYFLEILNELKNPQPVYYYSVFIIDLFLFDDTYSKYAKHVIATAALTVSFKILNIDLVILSGLKNYTEDHLSSIKTVEKRMVASLQIDKIHPNALVKMKYTKCQNFNVSGKIYFNDFFLDD